MSIWDKPIDEMIVGATFKSVVIMVNVCMLHRKRGIMMNRVLLRACKRYPIRWLQLSLIPLFKQQSLILAQC